ncbi:methionine sulfoxide reductase A [Listeria rocourtiae FSL F6-920]|nr:methionine sulfoxide reductase A [Listeria rocourtiae FSL F6-920]
MGVLKRPVVTAIEKAGPFYVAEEYHQDFYKKDPSHYKNYRSHSGRDPFIDANWKG